MAIKKSELYSSLWSSCDELRGGMDASQYKDYVLVILFIKYISDKYAGVVYAPISIPKGSSFDDLVLLKGKNNIGDDINKKIIAPLAEANKLPTTNMPDFADEVKLGSGREMIDRLTNLIAIFENPELDFGKNRADDDDILGDAYEYLMRHFASESGKSKGQFYTPSEVSRIKAKIVGIGKAKTTTSTTVYDPTCGSGSLLLKISDQANTDVTLYGQEKDGVTSGLAQMNMIMHVNPTAEIKQGNTLSTPLFINKNGDLKTFDYVVANPPFSDKRWTNGLDAERDIHERFDGYGIPPTKNGDYAYLLHIIRSLKSQGKGSCILPHGVLFRGNTEADIRENIIRKGFIKSIIGLPTNLFYGTSIPACIILIDKENAQNRKGIFMIDASKGFIKDGNKNRLREMDIHKIVDVFEKQIEIDGYSKLISFSDIEKNKFNLNIPRYIDSSEVEDLQDIEAHLLGDIPKVDVDELQNYWDILPTLRGELFSTASRSNNYLSLKINKKNIKQTIYQHPEFVRYMNDMNNVFIGWSSKTFPKLKTLSTGLHPKLVIEGISEELLSAYEGKPLINKYDVYQHLMNYWLEVMKDDCYIISEEGWNSNTHRAFKTYKSGKNKGKQVDKGWRCDLIPKSLVVDRYFSKEQQTIDGQKALREELENQLKELEEEFGSDDGALNSIANKTEAYIEMNEYLDLVWAAISPNTFESYQVQQAKLKSDNDVMLELKEQTVLQSQKNKKGNIAQKAVKDRLKLEISSEEKEILILYIELTKLINSSKKSIKTQRVEAQENIEERIANNTQDDFLDEISIIRQYIHFVEEIARVKKKIKTIEAELDDHLLEFYPSLTEEQIKQLVLDDKWMMSIENDIHTEMDRISQHLTQRIKELTERYEDPLPKQNNEVETLESAVNKHLHKMGFVWD